MAFCHLHVHTEYSLLDGSIKVADLFKHIKKLGMNSVAITEHGNVYAAVRKYKLAQKEGIKLIFGVEVYMCESIEKKDRKRFHQVLIAENNKGYQNLLRLVSIGQKDGFYYKPRIDKKLLKQYSEGLIGTTSCLSGEIPRAILAGNLELARSLLVEYISIFGKDRYFIELQNHGLEEQHTINPILKRFSEEFGVEMIVSNDAHYLCKHDARAHETLLAIQTNDVLSNPKRFKFPGDEFYIKTEEEMGALFPDIPQALINTQKIADRCSVTLSLGNYDFPEFPVPEGHDHKSYLRALCEQALAIRYKPEDHVAKKRLDYELGVIDRMGFNTYFLIVWDFVREAKKHCQVGPGRGSGAGSIVAYLLGITQLDPLELGLIFERFLNPSRISMPDFDIDFGDRDAVIEYVKRKYGEDKVALIGTFGTMQAKMVLKDVARAMDIPFEVANTITKHVTEKTIGKSLEVSKDLQHYQKQYEELFSIAKNLEGSVRHTGIHAAGVIWGSQHINSYLATDFKEGINVSELDMREVEDVGLIKFDFLGLETLNIFKKVLEFIGKDDQWLEQIPLDDEHVYEMLTKGHSVGVFQLESSGMQKTLRQVKPTCFDDIIAIVALYRPGSMDFIDVYARRKDGIEQVVYPHPLAQPILAPTYGILVYQEQVMEIAQRLAGLSMADADTLRKGIGKKIKELMDQLAEKFKEGCKEVAGMDDTSIDKLWANIIKFADYSFNKSHAAAYGLLSYRGAYLKHYYPVEYMAAVISSWERDPEKMAFYVEATKHMEIRVLSPHINCSERGFTVETYNNEQGVRFGLGGIKNVGKTAIEEIFTKRPFKDYQDFINKCDLGKVNKRVCKHLIMAGAFDEVEPDRGLLLARYDLVKKEVHGSQQKNLFGAVAGAPEYPTEVDYSFNQKLEDEKEVLGIYVSGHPLDQFPSRRFTPIRKFVPGLKVEVVGIIHNVNVITTKHGDEMCFVRLRDKLDECDVVVFPSVYNEIDYRLLKPDNIIIIDGTISEEKSLLAKDIRRAQVMKKTLFTK